MSNIYHTEPPTQGKVLLKTTYGDIDIELWPKEAPLACRNFIQLALEGYYDHTKVNRVIKEFMVQFGDPTGTGSGGDSIWGRPFKDEIHGRLLFNHRGQLAMANESTPNSNRSQFFVTLGACEWLNRKHTIFGKVTGDTIYNLLRLGESDVDASDKPVDPIELLGVEVLWNPFDDIIPRDIQKKEPEVVVDEKKKRKATKDLKLLSFGNEEEEEEDSSGVVVPRRMKNAQDIKMKKKKELSVDDKKEEIPANKINSAESEKIMKDNAKKKASKYNFDDDDDDDDDDKAVIDLNGWAERSEEAEKKKVLQAKGAEFAKLRDNLLRSRRAVKVLTGKDAEQIRADIAVTELISPLEQRRLKYAKKKVEFGSRQDETFAKLQNFTSAIRKNKKKASGGDDEEDGEGEGGEKREWKNSKEVAIERLQRQEAKDEEEKGEKDSKSSGVERGSEKGGAAVEFAAYNGQVLEEDSDAEDLGSDWHAGKLKFRKHITDKLRLGGDGRRVDDYKVIDSRAAKRDKKEGEGMEEEES